MPHEKQPSRRRGPRRNKVRVLAPATVYLTQKGRLRVVYDEPPPVEKLRLDKPPPDNFQK